MSDNQVNTSELLKSLRDKTEAPDTSPEPSVDVANVAPAAAEPEDEYQEYTSARVSMCLITNRGKRVNFTNYHYYTKDPEIVSYLDKEITQGLKGFTKGRILKASELDPEAAKKRQIIEEFKASQEGREFGDTKDKAKRTSVLSSGQVASAS